MPVNDRRSRGCLALLALGASATVVAGNFDYQVNAGAAHSDNIARVETAKTEEDEFRKIYGLDVVTIPTNRPSNRTDSEDVVYKTMDAKFRGIATEILRLYSKQQPVLVGTRSIEMTEKVVYGDVWERPGLSKRDRSLITVAALIAMYRGDQLTGHIERALANGVTREEIGELITHLAFYAGWPTAMTAGRIAKKVFDEAK